MTFCTKCGAELDKGKKFCASCGSYKDGASPQQGQQQYQQSFQQGVDRLTTLAQDTAEETGGMDAADIEKNKVVGGLAYFLFFLPLIFCPESRYGRFHANQGLLLLIMGMAGGIVLAVLSAIFGAIHLWFIIPIISFVIWIAVTVMGIIGLINGFTGKAKELPIIGGIRIIK